MTETFNWQQFSELWRERVIRHPDGSQSLVRVPPRIERYAEIHVYEPQVVGGQMVWQPVVQHSFDREFLGTVQTSRSTALTQAILALMDEAESVPAPQALPTPEPQDQSLHRLPVVDREAESVGAFLSHPSRGRGQFTDPPTP